MALYAVDSLMTEPIINEGEFGDWSTGSIVAFGFGCCMLSGLTRSFGMATYRQIKSEVDPITVVFMHAVLTSIAALPVMCKIFIQRKSEADSEADLIWSI